jgi:NhaP-type Na+/H+ or K+/H+ antiporter
MKPYWVPLALCISALTGLVMMLLMESALGDGVGLVLLAAPLAVLTKHALIRDQAEVRKQRPQS